MAWVYSGAAGNFIDVSLARRLNLPSEPLSSPLVVTALDGRPLGHGEVTHQTPPLRLSILQHQEETSFYLIQSPAFPIVLGYPWLLRHNPHIDWSKNTILEWGPTCHATCIFPCSSEVSLESQEPLDLSRVPPMYHPLKEVFSRHKATMLPPHKHSDCYIEIR